MRTSACWQLRPCSRSPPTSSSVSPGSAMGDWKTPHHHHQKLYRKTLDSKVLWIQRDSPKQTSPSLWTCSNLKNLPLWTAAMAAKPPNLCSSLVHNASSERIGALSQPVATPPVRCYRWTHANTHKEAMSPNPIGCPAYLSKAHSSHQQGHEDQHQGNLSFVSKQLWAGWGSLAAATQWLPLAKRKSFRQRCREGHIFRHLRHGLHLAKASMHRNLAMLQRSALERFSRRFYANVDAWFGKRIETKNGWNMSIKAKTSIQNIKKLHAVQTERLKVQ